tara:strand:- start:179 stop:571 length:393 start_codon:yes stop_codon:yes gene_type:complete
MSVSLDEQLVLHYYTPEKWDNIYPHKDWTLEEYQRFFKYLDCGWITQRDTLEMTESFGGVMFGFALCDWLDETPLPKYIKSLPRDEDVVDKFLNKQFEEYLESRNIFPKKEKKKKKLKIINSGKNLTDGG